VSICSYERERVGQNVRVPLAHARSYVSSLLAAVVLAVVSRAAEPVAVSGRAMGTTWSVKFIQPLEPLVPAFVERSVAERLEQLEQLLSTYRPQSALSRFNATQSTEWIPVAPELVQVAAESQRISELTNGAFDVTVLPLVQLWGFGPTRRTDSVPAPGEIAAARARVGWRRLEVRTSPPALRKAEASVMVDFSSMAKGLSADEISGLLTKLGAAHHLVQVGGDVKAAGRGPDDEGWRVAIENPPNLAAAATHVVTLRDMALSTSGDYRNAFVVKGRRYGHIIDPRLGEPVTGPIAAVSVVHSSCAASSAWATALFVVGADEGLRIAEAQEMACRFLQRGGAAASVQTTTRFDAFRN
jgi:thiamine biosynthesis lipoprotein